MQLTYQKAEAEDYESLNQKLKKKDSLEILKWAYQSYGDELVYACSFGAEGIVLIDMIHKVKKMLSSFFWIPIFILKKPTNSLIE